MLYSSPSGDIRDSLILVGTALVISLIIYLIKRKIILSIFFFSLLANAIFYFQFIAGSLMFKAYDLSWLRDFSRTIWPLINLVLLIILIIIFIKNAKNKNTKK